MAADDARRPRILAIGHFPPPRHGMSVATERFAELLDDRGHVTRLDISGYAHGRSTRHHVLRLGRTLRAAGSLARCGPHDPVYLVCDAGPGVLYTTLLLAVARARGCRRFLHHHSFAYVHRRWRPMAALVRVAGPATDHVFTCERQAERFGQHYPGARRRRALPITFTLTEPTGLADRRPGSRATPVVLGHFGNLSMAKGVGRAVATLDACLVHGIDAVLDLAGPVVDAEVDTLLAAARVRLGSRLTLRGEVRGPAKDAYLRGLDVFLFPTRYRIESFGIVAAEAMAAGVPTIAYAAGCLDADWVGNGGLVVDLDADFVDRAVAQIGAWVDDPSSHAAASAAALERARSGWEAGQQGVQELIEAIADATASASVGGR